MIIIAKEWQAQDIDKLSLFTHHLFLKPVQNWKLDGIRPVAKGFDC